MEYGINNFNGSVTDMCGRRVLGMGGSLNEYIRSGNPYESRYRAPVRTGLKKSTKNKIKSIAKIILAVTSIIAAIALIKSKKINFSQIINKAKKLPETIRNFTAGKFNFKKPNIKLPKISFDDLKNIFKKQSPTP